MWDLLLEVGDELLTEDSPLHTIEKDGTNVLITWVGLGVVTYFCELVLTHEVEVELRDAEDIARHMRNCGELRGFVVVHLVLPEEPTWAHLIDFDFEDSPTSVLLTIGLKTNGALVVGIELDISVELRRERS